ncbi:MAG: acyl-CoA dehydrogenase family protein [Trebonia sp.]|jgi:alkylation response protein AidB-like acyl-CoA dehydrogenase
MTTPLPELAPDEQELLSRVRELTPGFAADAAGYDERAEIPRAALDALHAAGVSRALLPAALGGDGISYLAFGELLRLVAEAGQLMAYSTEVLATEIGREVLGVTDEGPGA